MAQKTKSGAEKRKKRKKDLEELTPLLQLAVEEAEKYKDADHRCEELGIRIREKEEKLKKYQELEKLKKELETIEGKLETVSEKKEKDISEEQLLQKKDEEEKNAFQYWQMQEKNYKNTSLSTINWTVKNEAMTAVC